MRTSSNSELGLIFFLIFVVVACASILLQPDGVNCPDGHTAIESRGWCFPDQWVEERDGHIVITTPEIVFEVAS